MDDLDGLCEAVEMAVRNLVNGVSDREEYDVGIGKPFGMQAYQEGDVIQINIKTNKRKQTMCPECRSYRLIKFGTKVVKRKKVQQYQCKDCGRITVKPINDKEVL